MQRSERSAPHPLPSTISDLWATVRDALVEFVWADLRDGFIKLDGLPRAVRGSIWLGFLVTALTLSLLMLAPELRAYFPLHTSVTPVPGRGLHIPLLLFPLSLLLLCFAWAFLLSGARHSHWYIRLGVILLYTLTCANWLTPLVAGNPWHVVAALCLYLLLLASFLRRGRILLHTSYDFALTLLLVGAFFATVQYPLVLQDRTSGLPIGKTMLESNLRSLATVAIPLLILIGVDIADFTYSVSTWIGEAARRLIPQSALSLLALALFTWLVWQCLGYFTAQEESGAFFVQLHSIGGTALLLLLLWLVWLTLTHLVRPPSPLHLEDFSHAAGKVAFVLVIALLLPLLASFVFLEFAQVIQTLAIELQSGLFGDFQRFGAWATEFFAAASLFSSTIYNDQPLWQRLCALLAIAAALFLQRRGRPAAALYAATAGVNYLWVEVTRPGRWLQALSWTSPEPIVMAWLLCLLVCSIFWIWRRKLNAARVHHLLIVLLLLSLLRQTHLIASPLDPLFSLAGVGYLAVGLGWDLLTAGSWANSTSSKLPRSGRIYLYLGYIIMTAMLVNWAVAGHDYVLLERFTGEAALTGLSLLGYPFLYVSIYLLLTSPSSGQPGKEAQDAPQQDFGMQRHSE
jgi:hypothetical protein